MQDDFEKNTLHRLINKLPLKQKQIIKMKYFEDLKNKEIATMLKISEKTVSSALAKALKKLSKIRE